MGLFSLSLQLSLPPETVDLAERLIAALTANTTTMEERHQHDLLLAGAIRNHAESLMTIANALDEMRRRLDRPARPTITEVILKREIHMARGPDIIVYDLAASPVVDLDVVKRQLRVQINDGEPIIKEYTPETTLFPGLEAPQDSKVSITLVDYDDATPANASPPHRLTFTAVDSFAPKEASGLGVSFKEEKQGSVINPLPDPGSLDPETTTGDQGVSPVPGAIDPNTGETINPNTGEVVEPGEPTTTPEDGLPSEEPAGTTEPGHEPATPEPGEVTPPAPGEVVPGEEPAAEPAVEPLPDVTEPEPTVGEEPAIEPLPDVPGSDITEPNVEPDPSSEPNPSDLPGGDQSVAPGQDPSTVGPGSEEPVVGEEPVVNEPGLSDPTDTPPEDGGSSEPRGRGRRKR